MPNPNIFFENLGLWPKWKLPSEDALRVLQHLNYPDGEMKPRLYIQCNPNGSQSASLSHSDYALGWATRVAVVTLDEFVEIDEEVTANCIPSITAYRISEKGREAIVQSISRNDLRKLLMRVVPRILERNYRLTLGER